MKLNKPKNPNYCATVVKIETLVELENCDNVQGAIIMGNQVIVSKDIQVGDIGLYFPLETQLSKEYLSANNLYRKKELNSDPEARPGYFEENGRVRCVKFRSLHKSEGLYMPLSSLEFLQSEGAGLKLGDEFDELDGVEICRKYVVKKSRTPSSGKQNKSTKKYQSKLVDNQFRFHQDTSMLYKNLHRFNKDTLIHVSYKLHGTSGISSYILCKKKLSIWNKIGKFLGFDIKTEDYDYIYSSRKVIKNEELNPNAQHYYNQDIWGIANEQLKPFLYKGITLYYEIVGFLPDGGYIQKGYDYGCKEKEHAIYIYRITYTNIDGKVFEFSSKQVQEFCKKRGLNPVPELYYGSILDFMNQPENIKLLEGTKEFNEHFLDVVKKRYNEKNCYMCRNSVPEEGCVIRIEGEEFEAYKQKSNRFYELETVQLDKGEINIEEEN